MMPNGVEFSFLVFLIFLTVIWVVQGWQAGVYTADQHGDERSCSLPAGQRPHHGAVAGAHPTPLLLPTGTDCPASSSIPLVHIPSAHIPSSHILRPLF